MKEKIKQFRVYGGETPDGSLFFRYFNTFTAEEALNCELTVRKREGENEPVSLIEEYNPYSDKWLPVHADNSTS